MGITLALLARRGVRVSQPCPDWASTSPARLRIACTEITAMVTYFLYDCPCCDKSHLLCLRDGDAALPTFPQGTYRYVCPEVGSHATISGFDLKHGQLDDVGCPDESVVVERIA
jgi:hypothetical protein